MEALQTQFNAVIELAPLDSIFKSEVVLVQSPGMSQWLKIGLSQHIGVAAQIDFPLPSSFIWRLYQSLLDDVPRESAFNKANLAWKIHSLLPDCLGLSHFESLKHYLDDDQDALKRYMLAEKIADVFDQYLMYRPDWLALWESGQDRLNDTDVSIAPWQPDLWRKVVHYTKTLGQSHWHRANMHESLLSAIDTAPQSKFPDRISIFGISALPPAQLEVMEKLSRRTEVLIYLFNPSEHYWGDLLDEKTHAKIKARYSSLPNVENVNGQYFQVGNPLLSSWGKLGKEYLEQLLSLDAQWLDRFQDDFNESLLSSIQREVYHVAFKGEAVPPTNDWYINADGKIAISAEDNSVLLVDCHTPLREVELLHDYLLNCFAEDPHLTPKDVIVMMPDVGTFSPYIEAVFGGAKGSRFIPYAISDLALEQEKPILQSFIQLVELPFSRFKRSDILDLLAVDAISSKFEISPEDYQQIEVWLSRAAIKWGIDGEHKSSFGLPHVELNTWKLGLDKLLLGYVSGNETNPFNGIYGLDEVEGMASSSLAKIVAFIDALIEVKQKLDLDATLLEKASLLKTMIQTFYDEESESSWDLLQVQQVITALEEHANSGDFNGKVSARVVAYLIKQGLKEKGVGQRFLVGSVNFCTLMPMRAVPFKIVCLLGMNDQDYPKQVQPIGFDLVTCAKRRKGDRSRKFDNRYLFLEAILSARSKLYISYLGRSCFNNEPLMPSVLVSELLEYLDRAFYIEANSMSLSPSKHIHIEAPLQPFNALHYQNGELQSYNPTWAISENTLEKFNEESQKLNVTIEGEVEFAAFVKALIKPQAAFYQQTLGVRIASIEPFEEDDEPFSLDPLSRYQLLDESLRCNLSQTPIDEAQWLQRGVLPSQEIGTLALIDIETRTTKLASELRGVCKNKLVPQELYIECDRVTLLGWFDAIFADKQVFYRSASVKAKDKITGFLWHCAACVAGLNVTTYVMGLDDEVSFAPFEAVKAREYLGKWVQFYRDCMTSPQPFFATSSFEYAMTLDFQRAQEKFSGGQFIGVGDSEDPYVGICFNSLLEVEKEFCQLSLELLGPIVEHAKERRYEGA
ncbi:Exodeoxyribonuclease V gamma chain [Pseudoalteromonas luteoviolacea B = ATCC 29581]|nr:Exodeoxyribonuclease V gamma chain [Pseudoalteromonas luteoviolacea B = ATCC 29581]